MKCPACGKEMEEKDFGGVLVDVCSAGCNGIWFDWFELTKLDEDTEGYGGFLKEALNSAGSGEEGRGKLNCPKCGIPMHVHKYRSSKEINVDECYACGGFFLDSGELAAIRDNFMTDRELEEYTEKLIGDIPEFAAAQKDAEKEQLRVMAAKKFTRFLKFSR